ncbi:MAG: GerW family sporulation protein [Candidatus Zixiibacteriota bacterium]
MSNNVMELLQGIIGELKVVAKSETVVGQPVTAGTRTVIPVTRISVGFGAGGGEDGKPEQGPRFGGGGGGGAVIDPVAFLVLEDEKVSLLLTKKHSTIDKIVDVAPEIVNAIKKLAGKAKGDETDGQ